MENEIHNLSKELIQERLKVKSLSEELENPMNVHRWRKLEATDSETYELMTKI
jgi:ribosomal protein L29